MATARELLEQADALMRRNRKRGKGGGRLDASTLTGVLEARGDLSLAPTVILPESANANVAPIVLDGNASAAPDEAAPPPIDDDMPLDSLGDVPVLTDVVADWPADDASTVEAGVLDAATPAPTDEAREATPPSAVLPGDAFPASDSEAAAQRMNAPAVAVIEREVEADGEATAAVHDALTPAARAGAETAGDPAVAAKDDAATPPASPFLDDDFILEIPPLAEETSGAPSVPPPTVPAVSADSADWNALAEEVRMQVLQRLDLFTDVGLRDQLGARLSPIVERASAELIETINRELGELVRGYVAEAIEREIETWRNRGDK